MSTLEKLADEILSLIIDWGKKIDGAEFADDNEAGEYAGHMILKIIAKVQEFDLRVFNQVLDEHGHRR